MTIWLLAILMVASTVGLGYRQGVIRAAFSFLGILFAALLAAPLGRLIKPILTHVGVHNETLAWMIAPLIAFPLVLALFSGDFGFWPPHARKWKGYMPVLSRVVQATSREQLDEIYRELTACKAVLMAL